MSFVHRSAAQAYASVGLETDVQTVQPIRLVVMLYEGALQAIARAEVHMTARQHAEKGEKLSQAIRIIEEGLKASLDLEQGGDLALQLYRLYEYMSRNLMLSGARNDLALLHEVRRLLGELKQAWVQLEGRDSPEVGLPAGFPAGLAMTDAARPLVNQLQMR